MFFDAVIQAFDIMAHWRFWAVTLCYGALNLVPLLITGLLAQKSTAAGVVVWFISGIVWPVIVLTGAVLLLTPFMFAGVNEIGWDILGLFSIQHIAIVGGVGFIASLLVAFIPIVGHFQSIGNFVQVSAMLAVVAYLLFGESAAIWPGWFMGLGLAVTGGVTATILGMLMIGLIGAVLGEKRDDMVVILANPIAALASMVPACLYAGWFRVANGF